MSLRETPAALAAYAATVQARLAADPYEREALILDFLFAVAADEGSRVAPALKRLQSAGLGRALVAAITRAVAAGGVFRAQALASGGVLFSVRAAGLDEAQVCARAAQTLLAMQQHFACALPAVVLVLGVEEGAGARCMNETPGLAWLQLGAEIEAAELPALLAHELAHALLRSGNRVLDEGLALYAEKRFGAESSGRLAAAELAPQLALAAAQAFSLRAALASDLRADPYLRSLAPQLPPAVLYACGLALAQALCARLGPSALPALCQTLGKEAQASAHAALLEAALGEPLEHLYAPEQASDEALFSRCRERVKRLLGGHIGGADPAPAWWYGEARSLYQSLLRRLPEAAPPSLALRLLAARLEQCALFGYEAQADMARSALRCYRLIERLLLEWPDEPRVLYDAVRYFACSAREMGGSRERAEACLATLARVAPEQAAALQAELEAEGHGRLPCHAESN